MFLFLCLLIGREKRFTFRTEAQIWAVTLFCGTSVLYASRVAFPIAAADIAKEFTWNKTDSGIMLSCFFWGYALTQLFAGWIADIYGGENVLPISSLVWIILTFFTPQLLEFAYWSGFPLVILLLFRILSGVGQAFHVPSMASMIARHLTSADKGRLFGIILAGSHCGLVYWSICFLVCLHRIFNHKSLIWLRIKLPSPIPCVIRVLIDKSNTPTVKKPSQSVIFYQKLYRAAAAAQYAGGNAYYTMFSWLPSYFHETFPDAQGIVYNVVPNVSIVITSMLSPLLATVVLNTGQSMTVTRRLMEGTSLLGVAACLFIVPYTSSFIPALLVFSLSMACRGLHHGGVSVNPHDFAPHHTGAVFGIFNACGSITGFIGVYVAGHILDATNNNWSYVFIITGVQCIIGAVIYGLYGTGTKII
uniref:MFS domain-containing protein n=1 Tax=Angiostrongylus cantonensis TaxID=6313 RepID=A0A0K0DN16_ANGCA